MSLLYNWILNYSYYFIHWSRGHYYYNIILQNYVLLSADSFAILYIHILTWRRLLHLCTVYIISWVVEYLHDTHHELGAAGEPPAALVHHAGDDVNGHREHDGAVVLRWYTVQSLQVPQLKHSSYLSIGSYDYDKYLQARPVGSIILTLMSWTRF